MVVEEEFDEIMGEEESENSVELVKRSREEPEDEPEPVEPEEFEEAYEVTVLDITRPELLEAMINSAEILEGLSEGSIQLAEAKARMHEEVSAAIEKLRSELKPHKSRASGRKTGKARRGSTARASKRAGKSG